MRPKLGFHLADGVVVQGSLQGGLCGPNKPAIARGTVVALIFSSDGLGRTTAGHRIGTYGIELLLTRQPYLQTDSMLTIKRPASSIESKPGVMPVATEAARWFPR